MVGRGATRAGAVHSSIAPSCIPRRPKPVRWLARANQRLCSETSVGTVFADDFARSYAPGESHGEIGPEGGTQMTPHGELAAVQGSSRPPVEVTAAHYALPISKLRGVPFQVRVALKVRRITTCSQLLAATALVEDREALARSTKIAPEILTDLVQRADMARVNGIGAVFGLMLEELGVQDVETLAKQDAETLHEQLRHYNRRERLARRSPTPEEVSDWVGQARRLPTLLTYQPRPAAHWAARTAPRL